MVISSSPLLYTKTDTLSTLKRLPIWVKDKTENGSDTDQIELGNTPTLNRVPSNLSRSLQHLPRCPSATATIRWLNSQDSLHREAPFRAPGPTEVCRHARDGGKKTPYLAILEFSEAWRVKQKHPIFEVLCSVLFWVFSTVSITTMRYVRK